MHRHACGRGHYWDCEGGAIRDGDTLPSECICFDHGVLMEDGDHSQCTIEILTCPEHLAGQAGSPDATEQVDGDRMEDGFVPLKIPDAEMLQDWADNKEPCIGFCFMCGHIIPTVDDLIPGTSSHNCAEGLAFDARIRNERGGRPAGG